MMALASYFGFLLSVFLWCMSPLKARAEDPSSVPMSVGVILPLTGDFGYLGDAIRQGIQLRQKESPHAGVRFVIEDDQFDRKRAVSAFQKLASVDKVQLVMSYVAPVVEPLVPLAERAQVPIVAVWDFNHKIHQPERYSFSVGFSNARAGEQLAEFVCNKLALRNVAILSALDEWGEVVSAAFGKTFAQCGGKVPYHEQVNFDVTDVSSFVTKIKALHPDGVFFPLYSSSFSSFIKQARAQRLSSVLLTGEGMFPAEERDLGAMVEGIYFQRIWVDDEAFLKKLEPLGLESSSQRGFVALGYDLASFVFEARKALPPGEVTGPLVRDAISKLNFKGLTGSVPVASFKGKDLRILRFHKGVLEVAG